jgi:hypothetical protein
MTREQRRRQRRAELEQAREDARREIRRRVVDKPRSRKEIVEKRESARVEKRLQRTPPPPRRERFADAETVSGAVAQRSGARLAALGGSVKGVDGADGYTGREARLIRDARREQINERSRPTGPGRSEPPDRGVRIVEDDVRRQVGRKAPQLQGRTLKQLARKRLQGLRDAGDELRIPPRPGEPVARIPEMPGRRRRAAGQRR